MYKVITTCGSTRFAENIRMIEKTLVKEGWLVFGWPIFGKEADEGMNLILDDMHRQRILMSDAIFVCDIDSYIGDSTRAEIKFAKLHKKEIFYYSDQGDEVLKISSNFGKVSYDSPW